MCSPEISELLSFGMNSRDVFYQAEHIVCENSRLSAWEQFCDGNWTGMKVAGKHGKGGIMAAGWEGIPGETEKPKNNHQRKKN